VSRKLLLAVLFLAFSRTTPAQTQDIFYGLNSTTGPGSPYKVAMTLSQTAGTSTQTVTITNSTCTALPAVSGDYTLSVTNGPTYVVGTSVPEPFEILGTGTAADYTTAANDNSWFQGASSLTSVTTGTPCVFTLNAQANAPVTLTNVSGFIEPAHGYTGIGTVPVQGSNANVYWDPLNHYLYFTAQSAFSVTMNVLGLHYSQGISSSVSSGTTVTATMNGTVVPDFVSGEMITVSGSSDSTYNCPQTNPCQLLTASGTTITYRAAAPDGLSSTGGTLATEGWNKYPGTSTGNYCPAAQDIQLQVQEVGFNTLGEDWTGTYFGPGSLGACPSNLPNLMMYSPGGEPPFNITYSLANLHGRWTQPAHEMINGLDQSYPSLPAPHNEPDFWDPNMLSGALNNMGPSGPGQVQMSWFQSPAACCMMFDDSDNFGTTAGGGQFPGTQATTESTGGTWHLGFIAAIAPLHQSMAVSNNGTKAGLTVDATAPLFYPNSVDYTKQLSASAPAGCYWTTAKTSPFGGALGPSFAPCSWPDYVRNWYQTVANMNTAWGSHYSSFGTSEIAVNGVTGTFSGATITFTANPYVTPESVEVMAQPSGGTAYMISGDCPWFKAQGCTGAAVGQGIWNNVTDLTNPTNPTFCKNFASAGSPSFYDVTVGQACLDTNNNIEIVTTAGQMPILANFAAWPATCTGTETTTQGTAVFTCYTPGISSGSITYATGAASITFTSAPAAGVTITLNYTTKGWGTQGDSGCTGCGTGLEDEDGSTANNSIGGAALVGQNPYCVINVNNQVWQPNHAYTAYGDPFNDEIFDATSNSWQWAVVTRTSGASAPTFSATQGVLSSDGQFMSIGEPVCAASGAILTVPITANQAWAAVATDWTMEPTAKMAQNDQTVGHDLYPGAVIISPNFSLQSYGIPSYWQQLAALNAFTDMAFTSVFPEPIASNPLADLEYKYVTNYYTKPIIMENFLQVSSGWEKNDTGCSVFFNCTASPSARITAFYDAISAQLNETSPSGLHQAAGETWWGNGVFQGLGFNWIDSLNNLPDGKENVVGSVACDPPLQALTCGGELSGNPWTGIDIVDGTTGLKAALSLWMGSSTPPPSFLIRPGRRSSIW
jgi:hypothetical protein